MVGEWAGFHIHLDTGSDNSIWPGFQLNGTVTVPPQVTDRGQVPPMHVILEGRSKAKTITGSGSSKTTYRSRAPLLFEMCPLTQNKNGDWRFSIPVPEKTRAIPDIADLQKKNVDPALNNSGNYWIQKWPPPRGDNFFKWPTEMEQKLPPSFSARISVSGWLEADIEYSLAVFVRRPKPGSKKTSELLPLEVCRANMVRFPVYASSEEWIRRFQSELCSTRISFNFPASPKDYSSNPISRITSKSNSATIPIELTLETPRTLIAGQLFNVVVKIRPGDFAESMSLEDLPDVQLHSMRVKLVQVTRLRVFISYFRIPTEYSHAQNMVNVQGDLSPDSQSFPWQETEKSIPEKKVTWPVGPVPAGVPGSFLTFNIGCIYHIDVAATISCNGKKETANIKHITGVNIGTLDKAYRGESVEYHSYMNDAVDVGFMTLRIAGGLIKAFVA